MVCAPTGSGKTASFVVPLLHLLRQPEAKGFRAVVVSPTRELAKQVYYLSSPLINTMHLINSILLYFYYA